jgi:hypothetical protein
MTDLLTCAARRPPEIDRLSDAMHFLAQHIAARDFEVFVRLLTAAFDPDTAADVDRSAALRSTIT